MYCARCGTELAEWMLFCPRCGTKINDENGDLQTKTAFEPLMKDVKIESGQADEKTLFLESRLSKVLIGFFAFGILAIIMSAVNRDMLSAIIAGIMTVLFAVAYLMGAQLIKSKIKDIRLIVTTVAFVLPVLYFGAYSPVPENGSAEESGFAGDVVSGVKVNNVMPEPQMVDYESDIGNNKTENEESDEESAKLNETNAESFVNEENFSEEVNEGKRENLAKEKKSEEKSKKAEKSEKSVSSFNGSTVYTTPSGKKYHYSISCAGKNAVEKSIDEVNGKYDPCKKCAQ